MFDWLGWRVFDSQGRRVGTLSGIYEDGATRAPAWFLVRLGRFSTRYVLTPPADVLASEGRLWLPYLRETIEGAPLHFAPPAATSPSLEQVLRAHYRLDGASAGDIAVNARRLPA